MALALDHGEDYRTRIWRLIGFLGRYGHQPAAMCLAMPVDDLTRLADSVGFYLEQEADSMKVRGD